MYKRISRFLNPKSSWRALRASVYEGAATSHVSQDIFDLNNLDTNVPRSECTLVSTKFGVGSVDEPQIQSFLVKDGIVLQPNNAFLGSTESALAPERIKPSMTIDQPVYLLPYYTNQFGHFTGEVLGALITFLKILPDNNRKLIVLCPNEFDVVVARHCGSDKWTKIDSQLALKNNLRFTDAIPLPRIGAWQNLILGQKIFGGSEFGASNKHRRLFLTSERASRILNIAEVVQFLKEKDFYILNPQLHDFEHNVCAVRDATYLLSENGSILHNILYGRTRQYFVLASEGSKKLTAHEFAGGGFFGMFHFGQINYLFCDPVKGVGDHHPWSNQLQVNMKTLGEFVEALS